jgi:hypothetical protein
MRRFMRHLGAFLRHPAHRQPSSSSAFNATPSRHDLVVDGGVTAKFS